MRTGTRTAGAATAPVRRPGPGSGPAGHGAVRRTATAPERSRPERNHPSRRDAPGRQRGVFRGADGGTRGSARPRRLPRTPLTASPGERRTGAPTPARRLHGPHRPATSPIGWPAAGRIPRPGPRLPPRGGLVSPLPPRWSGLCDRASRLPGEVPRSLAAPGDGRRMYCCPSLYAVCGIHRLWRCAWFVLRAASHGVRGTPYPVRHRDAGQPGAAAAAQRGSTPVSWQTFR